MKRSRKKIHRRHLRRHGRIRLNDAEIIEINTVHGQQRIARSILKRKSYVSLKKMKLDLPNMLKTHHYTETAMLGACIKTYTDIASEEDPVPFNVLSIPDTTENKSDILAKFEAMVKMGPFDGDTDCEDDSNVKSIFHDINYDIGQSLCIASVYSQCDETNKAKQSTGTANEKHFDTRCEVANNKINKDQQSTDTTGERHFDTQCEETRYGITKCYRSVSDNQYIKNRPHHLNISSDLMDIYDFDISEKNSEYSSRCLLNYSDIEPQLTGESRSHNITPALTASLFNGSTIQDVTSPSQTTETNVHIDSKTTHLDDLDITSSLSHSQHDRKPKSSSGNHYRLTAPSRHLEIQALSSLKHSPDHLEGQTSSPCHLKIEAISSLDQLNTHMSSSYSHPALHTLPSPGQTISYSDPLNLETTSSCHYSDIETIVSPGPLKIEMTSSCDNSDPETIISPGHSSLNIISVSDHIKAYMASSLHLSETQTTASPHYFDFKTSSSIERSTAASPGQLEIQMTPSSDRREIQKESSDDHLVIQTTSSSSNKQTPFSSGDTEIKTHSSSDDLDLKTSSSFVYNDRHTPKSSSHLEIDNVSLTTDSEDDIKETADSEDDIKQITDKLNEELLGKRSREGKYKCTTIRRITLLLLLFFANIVYIYLQKHLHQMLKKHLISRTVYS